MAEQSHIARPYARAVFELAREEDNLAGWGKALALFAAIVDDAQAADFIHSPRIDAAQLARAIVEIAAGALNITPDKLHPPAINLIKLLARNRRVNALPAIAREYDSLRNQAEGVVVAELITAEPVAERQRELIKAALHGKLGRKVSLTCSVNRDLIGGAVVRAGDLVIDASLRGQLRQLAGAVNA